MNFLKTVTYSAICAAGVFFEWLFGPINAALIALIAACLLDYITGVICACMGVSQKSESHALSSTAGWLGLMKKGVMLLLVGLLHFIDNATGVPIRDAAIFAFLANELLSIIENCGLMGIPIPDVVTRVVEVLKDGKSKT